MHGLYSSICAILCSITLMCSVFAPWAQAQVQRFATFSIDVPQDWQIHDVAGAVTFTHPQKICSIDVLVVPHQDVAFRELGIAFYQNLKGKSPKEEEGGMSFVLNNEYEIPARVHLSQQGIYFTGVTVIGHCVQYKSVLTSITLIDAEGSFFTPSSRLYPLLEAD